MSGHDRLYWSGAVALSLSLHGMMLFNTGSLAGNQEQPQQKRHVTRVSFRSAASPPTTPQALPQETPKELEPEVTEAPEPPPKPTPPKPEKRAERAHEVEPRPSPEPAPQIPPVPTSATAEKVPAASEAVSGTVDDEALIEKAKQEYLRRLMAHIEKHKHYPRTARRRHLEGDVRVSFTLQAGGRVVALVVDGGPEVLSSAALQAVEEAVPLPEPPPSLGLPWPVAFTMRFSLN
jgi:protein TonB